MIDLQIKNKKDCMGCSACYNICPQKCVAMNIDKEGFEYPKVDNERCINCGLCIKVCPIINKIETDLNYIRTYACINKNENIRLKSSSGGIFTLIAEQLLSQGGIVFGSGFNTYFKVEHSYIEKYEELEKFRGSKYVQSKIGYTYKQAKDFLDKGKQVLFTGTPCQIVGLKSYLEKEYDNLFCQDIICQGVPSSLVWKYYLDCRIRKDGKGEQIKKISFRVKDTDWQNYKMCIMFQSKYSYLQNKNNDNFMKTFMNFLSIRPSCFECAFKGKKRKSDITLADFWGVQNIKISFIDNKGTSLVLVNTDKGNILFERIKKSIKYQKVKFQDSIKYNPMYNKCIPNNSLRNSFFCELQNVDFDLLVKKYTKEPILKILLSKLKTAYLKVKHKLNKH
ncbi:MAG: Coenzyme F420 hydrogenase/dehydrogenase, beta subunit C-terminal domain [Clostridia bacterium]|nr:Coenzyme F420 hydrogenase/dehydrogenase, beta subunit C-terminal domain [Clostridia bacterium]